MGLRYTVITSVTRDDLEDGGASHFARTIGEIRRKNPGTRVEALIPDFRGDREALAVVFEAGPDVLNHNLETVPSLYPLIRRPRESYRRSLGVIASAKDAGILTKSGMMVGLGETQEEIVETLADLFDWGCDLLTIGQYLRPAEENPPVAKYYPPSEFAGLRTRALELGFLDVAAGPLVRSSYEAGRLYESAHER